MLKEISARLKTDLTEIRVAAKKSWDLSKREFVSRAKTFESKRKSEPDKQY